MAGRGTDIMLGGNSEFLAKQEMRKLKYEENLIEQSTAFNETSDEEILEARKKFKELVSKYNDEIKDEKEKAVQEQDFEKAAQLRDMIHALEDDLLLVE